MELRGHEAEGWLEFVISACEGESAGKVEAMCDDLAACVSEELSVSRRGGRHTSTRRAGKLQRKRRGIAERVVSVDVARVSRPMGLRATLVGDRGASMEIQSGARMELRGHEAEDRLEFVITAGGGQGRCYVRGPRQVFLGGGLAARRLPSIFGVRGP